MEMLQTIRDMRQSCIESGGNYRNTVTVLQSSGTGKSRTVHEMSRLIFTLPFNLRMPDQGLLVLFCLDSKGSIYIMHRRFGIPSPGRLNSQFHDAEGPWLGLGRGQDPELLSCDAATLLLFCGILGPLPAVPVVRARRRGMELLHLPETRRDLHRDSATAACLGTSAVQQSAHVHSRRTCQTTRTLKPYWLRSLRCKRH